MQNVIYLMAEKPRITGAVPYLSVTSSTVKEMYFLSKKKKKEQKGRY